MQMHAIVIRQTLSGVVLLSGGQHRLSNHEIITSACCFDRFSLQEIPHSLGYSTVFCVMTCNI